MKLLLMLTNVVIIRFTLITVCTLPSSCTCTRITIDLVCTSTSIDTRITSTLVDICNQERCLSSRIVLPSTIKGLAKTSVHIEHLKLFQKYTNYFSNVCFQEKNTSPSSQCVPCQPPAHIHVYWFCRLLHVAPFWHGLLAHSSISVKE